MFCETFRTHLTPHILPIGEETPIPLSESEKAERYSTSDLPERTSETSYQSPESHIPVQDEELRNEVLIECILDLTKEGLINKKPAHQYLSKKLSGAQNGT